MKTRILALILILCLALSLAACGGGKTDGGKDDYVTRTYGVTRYLGSFLKAGDVTANEGMCSLVYDTLWIMDPDTKEVRSNVLEDWYYKDDLTFVIKLKKGVYFTNGDEAHAEDVIFSLTNLITRGSPMQGTYGKILLDKCYCEDDYTAVIVWEEPWGPGITFITTFLYNKSWSESVGWSSTDWLFAPCGSGPYKVAEYKTDEYCRLVKRDDYWNKDVKYGVDEWVVKFFPDSATLDMELEQGNVDITGSVTNTDFEIYKNDPSMNIGTLAVSSNDVLHMLFAYQNTDVFDDINVRKAIAHGVDWNALGEMAYDTLYTPATSILASTSPFYKNVGAYEYDPDLARQYLAEGGYKDGDIVIHSYQMETPAYKALCQGLQFYLSQIGITVDIEFGDTVTVLGAWLQPGGTDIGWQSNPDGSTGEPYSTLIQLSPDSNVFIHGLLPDETFGDLAHRGLHTVDVEQRKEIYNEMQQYLHDNYLTIPVCEPSYSIAFRSDVFSAEAVRACTFSDTCISLRELSEVK